MKQTLVSAILALCILLLASLSPAEEIQNTVQIRATEVHEAARSGDPASVKRIVSQNPEAVKAVDERNATPLHMAADSGRVDIASYLLDSGADIMARDADGDTPLHWAAYAGFVEVIKLLIERGAEVDGKNNDDNTPLHYAAQRGYPDAIRILVESGADINAQNYGGEPPVIKAALGGRYDAVSVLHSLGADLEIKDNYGRTPLLLTARETGNVPMAKLLLESGADINARDRSDDTPLILAAWRGYAGLVDLLLDNGATFDHAGPEGSVLLVFSAKKKLDRLFTMLADKGADLTIGIDGGGSLLHAAAYSGSVPILQTLLDRGLAVNQTDAYGYSPLHYAAERGRRDAVQLLIASGAGIDQRTLAGSSAYNLAATFGKAETANVLSSTDADTSAQQFPRLTDKYMGQAPPGDKPAIFGLGIVATHEGEHGCITFSPDYTEAFWGSDFMLNDSGYGTGNVMTSRFENGQWTIPEFPSFAPDFDSRADVPMFSPDGKRLYFISRRPLSPGRSGGKENIWFVEKLSDGWSEAMPLGSEVNSMDTHWQFGIDKDYNLYFTTSDENSLGMADLFFSQYENGTYTKPVNLGGPLSSEASEGTPYISPEGDYLIFTRHGYDDRSKNGMYLSYHKADGGWTDPIHLNAALGINRLGLCPIVSPDCKYLFLIKSSVGDNNIHWMRADFIERLRPTGI